MPEFFEVRVSSESHMPGSRLAICGKGNSAFGSVKQQPAHVVSENKSSQDNICQHDMVNESSW